MPEPMYREGDRVRPIAQHAIEMSGGTNGTVLACGDGFYEVCVDWDNGAYHYTYAQHHLAIAEKIIIASKDNPVLTLVRQMLNAQPTKRDLVIEFALLAIKDWDENNITQNQLTHAARVLTRFPKTEKLPSEIFSVANVG